MPQDQHCWNRSCVAAKRSLKLKWDRRTSCYSCHHSNPNSLTISKWHWNASLKLPSSNILSKAKYRNLVFLNAYLVGSSHITSFSATAIERPNQTITSSESTTHHYSRVISINQQPPYREQPAVAQQHRELHELAGKAHSFLLCTSTTAFSSWAVQQSALRLRDHPFQALL